MEPTHNPGVGCGVWDVGCWVWVGMGSMLILLPSVSASSPFQSRSPCCDEVGALQRRRTFNLLLHYLQHPQLSRPNVCRNLFWSFLRGSRVDRSTPELTCAEAAAAPAIGPPGPPKRDD